MSLEEEFKKIAEDFKAKADTYKDIIREAKKNVIKQEVEKDLQGKDIKF